MDAFSFSDVAGAFLPDPPNLKPLLQSKTIIVNAIIALAACYPPAAAWVSAHPVLTLQFITYANVALRLVTHSRIALYRAE
jgi:hypothetical protein